EKALRRTDGVEPRRLGDRGGGHQTLSSDLCSRPEVDRFVWVGFGAGAGASAGTSTGAGAAAASAGGWAAGWAAGWVVGFVRAGRAGGSHGSHPRGSHVDSADSGCLMTRSSPSSTFFR